MAFTGSFWGFEAVLVKGLRTFHDHSGELLEFDKLSGNFLQHI